MTPIIEKLQKLLNHERSARSIGNQSEAEAFTAKIAEMLFAHKLSMSEVEIADEERDEPVSSEKVEGFTAPWAGVLCMATATASFCKVLKSHNGYVFIGCPTDRNAAISLYRYLATMGGLLCDSELKAYRQSEEGVYEFAVRPTLTRRWKVSFLRGYASAIYHRIECDRKTLTANAQNAGTSLVYIDKSTQAVDLYIRQTYGKLRSSHSTSYMHSGAYEAGKVHGNSVSLKSSAALGSGS